MDNVLVITLVFWPVVVLLCAGINMLVSRTFSWAELIFDLLIGVVAGYFLYAGAQSGAQGVVSFFFVFSHGMLALIWTLTNGFMDKPADFFWAMAGLRIGATLWAAAWDNVSVALGAKLHWAPFLFSLVVAPVKMMFALATSAIGLLIWLSGLAWAIFGKGEAGFAGGVLFTEFGPGGAGAITQRPSAGRCTPGKATRPSGTSCITPASTSIWATGSFPSGAWARSGASSPQRFRESTP